MNKIEKRQEVDVSFLGKILKANIILILIVAMVCGAGLGALRYFRTVPTYTSTVSFFVNGLSMTTNGTQFVNPGNTTGATTLAESFQIAIKSRRVVEKAVDFLPGEKKYDAITVENARALMSVSLETQILTVSVTHTDAEIAYQLAVAMEKAAPGELDSYVGLGNKEGETPASVVKVIEPAVKDASPSSKNTVVYALIGFILGAAAVYIIAFLRAFFDRTIYTDEEIKNNFELPIIGQIPSWNPSGSVSTKKSAKSAKNEIIRNYTDKILSSNTPFAVSEAFKLLRTNMSYTAHSNNGGMVYGITSSNAGEGKSIVAANIAISFAQMGKKVLIIDGDLRAPVQRKIFKLDAKAAGLSDLLAGLVESGDVLRSLDSVENLTVLQSGRIPPNPAELLASPRMADFVDEVRQSYDIVIIDLPPVGEVADAGVISGLVDHYAMVVRSNHSNIGFVSAAVDLLQGFGGSVVGFVVNDVNLKGLAYYSKAKYSKSCRYGEYARRASDTDSTNA